MSTDSTHHNYPIASNKDLPFVSFISSKDIECLCATWFHKNLQILDREDGSRVEE